MASLDGERYLALLVLEAAFRDLNCKNAGRVMSARDFLSKESETLRLFCDLLHVSQEFIIRCYQADKRPKLELRGMKSKSDKTKGNLV